MSFPKYEAYKDSGVEWLGEVPERWTVVSLKWLSPVLRGASPRPIDDQKYFDEDGEYGWVRISDVSASNGQLFETTQRLSPLGSSLSVKLEPGSLFLSIAGSVGKPCVTKIKACIHDGFVYFPLLNTDQKLLYRVFEDGLCFGGLGKMGTQLNLNTETVGGIRIAIPPESELTKIITFLDYETTRIDALIAEQQRLIELLKEKRQAVISHAVTKGLDPTVPMKDSGVEWLGEVPEHWRLMKLGLLASERCDGPFGSALKSEHYTDEGIRVIRLQNIKTGWFNNEDSAFIDSEYYHQHINKSDVKDNDLLVAGLGDQNNTVGRACVAPKDIHPAMVKADCFRFRLLLDIALPEFISDQLTAGSDFDAGILSTGSTRSRIPLSSMSERIIALPPIQEQALVAQFISETKERIDVLLNEATFAISLLQERRSALISAAVTGKIDVRGWRSHSKPS